MAFTEKVSLSGSALSFLLYECAQSQHGQEGFLLGDVTSEVTSHISDSQNDSSRLDTEIAVRAVLPLPAVAQIYNSCGRVKEDQLVQFLSNGAADVVGWYKYRKGNSLKPTLRDKMITRGLQRYFERNHNKRNFVFCKLTSKESASASTHTFTYRFGKINCLDAYEFVEDITPNLGEKLGGYRRPNRRSTRNAFNAIVQENNLRDSSANAIQRIQAAVDARLLKEAKTAVITEKIIRELEAEIRQMTTIMSERHCSEVNAEVERRQKAEMAAREKEMADICAAALATPIECDLDHFSQYLSERNADSDDVEIIERRELLRAPSPILPSKPIRNYAAALRNQSKGETSAVTSSKTNEVSEDLIDLDVTDKPSPRDVTMNHRNSKGDSSPDY